MSILWDVLSVLPRLCASFAVACHRQVIRFLSLWLRTKPKCLVIVQSVIFLLDGLFDFLIFFKKSFFCEMGLFLSLFCISFVLMEMPCTCQVYCMNVITEPWRKYLNDALEMCCSDNFSFQSEINYCFIKRLSSWVFIFSPSFLWPMANMGLWYKSSHHRSFLNLDIFL